MDINKYKLNKALDFVDKTTATMSIPVDMQKFIVRCQYRKGFLPWVIKRIKITTNTIKEDHLDFYCCRKDKNSYNIDINDSLSQKEKNLAIAICLGHILLGNIRVGEARFDREFKSISDLENRSAYKVATHILIPDSFIRRDISMKKFNVTKLAESYGVSESLAFDKIKKYNVEKFYW